MSKNKNYAEYYNPSVNTPAHFSYENNEDATVKEIQNEEKIEKVSNDMIVNSRLLNLRSTPSSDNNYNIVKVLKSGEVVMCLEDVDDIWVKVKTWEDEVGYVMKKFLK